MLADSTSQYCFVPAKPAESTSDYYFVLHRLLPNTSRTTSCYRTRAKYFLVQVCTTKLAENTSQYDFVLQSAQKVPSGITLYLQSFHKVLPTTTSYYTACAKYFQYYFAPQRGGREGERGAREDLLQSLQKVVPGTTLYYKDCRKYLPVLLRTIKLAESISQYVFVLQSSQKVPSSIWTTELPQNASRYYFVLQSLRAVLPSTTSYYKACTRGRERGQQGPRTSLYYKASRKYLPGALRTTKLAQNNSQYSFVLPSLQKILPRSSEYYCLLQSLQKLFEYYFVLRSLQKVLPSNTVYYKAAT